MPGMLVKEYTPPTDDAKDADVGDSMHAAKKPPPPPPPPTVQLWAKRLPRGAMAVLLINASPKSVAAGVR